MSQETGSIKLTNALFGEKTFDATEANVDANASELSDILQGSGGIEVSEVEDKVDINGSELDEIYAYASITDFPQVGEAAKLYIDTTDNRLYRWTGSEYSVISASGGSGFIDMEIDSNGDLIYTRTSSIDADFSINSDGELVYTAV